jgi:hypothetical protein
MYICILVVLEFERRDLHLLGRCSSTWVTPPSPFLLLVMFQAGFYIFVQSWPPAYGLPCSWNDKNMPPCPVHLLRSGLTNFLPRLFLNWNLLISVSQDLELQAWTTMSNPWSLFLQAYVWKIPLFNCHPK